MIVILLGPPGSGKGTQAKKLWSERKLPQLSTGDMLRSAITRGTQLGMEAKKFMDQGQLVPDEVVIGLIKEKSESPDCKDGYVLDGFPRNIAQAEALDKMLKQQVRQVDRAVLFDIADEELVRRLSGRRTCLKCSAMYHVESAPPKVGGVCDLCGNKLVQREDDSTDVIKKRLSVYHQQTEPLIGFYRTQKKLRTLDARKSAVDVGHALAEALT
jgi:adenylate kinase